METGYVFDKRRKLSPSQTQNWTRVVTFNWVFKNNSGMEIERV